MRNPGSRGPGVRPRPLLAQLVFYSRDGDAALIAVDDRGMQAMGERVLESLPPASSAEAIRRPISRLQRSRSAASL